MVPKLSDVKNLVDQLALKIQAPESLLPTYGDSLDGGHPYVEIDRSGLLFYLADERGSEIKRYIALDIDDLLYNIFKDVTFLMATKNFTFTTPGKYSRRVWFVEQERLLGLLDESWGLRKIKEHEDLLKVHPFNDRLF